MITDTSFGYLKAITVLFAQKMCQAVNDMCGVQYSINKESLREGSFSTPYRIVLFAGFSGAIQGNYIMSLDDTVALKLIGAGDETVSPEKALDFRKEYSGLLKESLNIAVGQAIEELGKSYCDLAFSPGTAVFGEIEFPAIMSASIEIEGREGKILCGFSLNLAILKIGEKLDETLKELDRRSNEAKEIGTTIESVLTLLNAGFVFIDPAGVILPGFSRSMPSVIGLPPATELAGRSLSEIIGIPGSLFPEWERWLTHVFNAPGEMPFNETVEPSAPVEFINVRSRRLKLSWLPIIDTKSGRPVKLLAVIKDITVQSPPENG